MWYSIRKKTQEVCPMASKVDLHIHTTASDGSDSPDLLLKNLKKAGITTFAVTDHDTIDGALEMEKLVTEAFRFIRGIEFSCQSPAGKCHILGYGFHPSHPVFLAALEEGKQLRQEKLERRIRYLRSELGIELTEEENRWLRSLESPGKPHFGKIVVAHGLADSIDTAIRKYINPCKVLRDRIDAETAVKAILAAGGIPVWAHPLGGEGEKRLTVEKFHTQLEILMRYGIRGLECHYSRYETHDREFLTAQAEQHNLLISGGSDYHGTNKQNLHLGQLSADGKAVAPESLSILAAL